MKTTYYVAATIDGFIADRFGGIGFLAAVGGEPDAGPYEDFLRTVDGLVMGRRTYDQIVSFGDWPYADIPTWVMSHRPDAIENGIIRNCSLATLYSEIESSGIQHLWLVGGGNVAFQFLESNLIDRLVLSLLPIAIGGGIPLFSGVGSTKLFSLQSTKKRKHGVIEIVYDLKASG